MTVARPDARTRLVRSMRDGLQRRGLHGTGLTEVLDGAQAPKGVMYYHFPGGKSELAVAAINETVDGIAQRLDLLLAQSNDPFEAMERWLADAARQLERSRFERGCPLATVSLESTADDAVVRAALAAAFARLRLVIERAMDRFGIADAHASALASLVVAAYEGGLMQGTSRRELHGHDRCQHRARRRDPRDVPARPEMTAQDSTMSERLTLVASDGYELCAMRYTPSGAATGRIVLGGATGVPQGFYRRFAEFAVGRGYEVTTLDYRGIASSAPSTLKGFRMDYRDWARLDLAAAVDAASDGGRERVLLVCHSYGGQALGLLPHPDRIAAMYTFGTGSGWAGWMTRGEQLRVRFMWRVIARSSRAPPGTWRGAGWAWARTCPSTSTASGGTGASTPSTSSRIPIYQTCRRCTTASPLRSSA